MNQKVRICKLSFCNVFFSHVGEILILLILIVGFSYAQYWLFSLKDITWIGKIIIVLISLFCVILIGVMPLLICWNHYQHDKYTVMTIDHENNQITYRNRRDEKKIKTEDILYICRYYSVARMLNEEYYIITLKDYSKIVVTSLLISGLSKKIPNVPSKEVSTYRLFL